MANYENLFDLADTDLLWEAIGPEGVEDDEAEARWILGEALFAAAALSQPLKTNSAFRLGLNLVNRILSRLKEKADSNGLSWCERCADVVTAELHITHHETRDDPADGIAYCPDCKKEIG